jgi:hypothetical protein
MRAFSPARQTVGVGDVDEQAHIDQVEMNHSQLLFNGIRKVSDCTIDQKPNCRLSFELPQGGQSCLELRSIRLALPIAFRAYGLAKNKESYRLCSNPIFDMQSPLACFAGVTLYGVLKRAPRRHM